MCGVFHKHLWGPHVLHFPSTRVPADTAFCISIGAGECEAFSISPSASAFAISGGANGCVAFSISTGVRALLVLCALRALLVLLACRKFGVDAAADVGDKSVFAYLEQQRAAGAQ